MAKKHLLHVPKRTCPQVWGTHSTMAWRGGSHPTWHPSPMDQLHLVLRDVGLGSGRYRWGSPPLLGEQQHSSGSPMGRITEQRKSCVGLAQCSFISMVHKEVLPHGLKSLHTNPHTVPHHNPPQLLLASPVTSCSTPAGEVWIPQRGGSHIFPSATYRALLLPRCRMVREGPAVPSTPQHQEAAQILLEQGLPRVGYCKVLPGLGWLKGISQVLCGTFDPSRATQEGLQVAAGLRLARTVFTIRQGQVTTV